MKIRNAGIAALALALPVLAGACDGGTDSDFGRVSIQLTDAPGDEVVKAWVTFTDIYLQGSSGEADPADGRVYLLADADEAHELTELANAVTSLVEDKEVPTGTYGQLRVVMSGACVETAEGSIYASSDAYDRCGPPTGELRMPSMQQSGAKVLLNGLQVTAGQHILLLDFDVEDSFGHAAGNSGAWVMTPVIHTARVDMTGRIDVSLDGGDVTLPEDVDLGDFSATLLPTDGDSARVSFTDEDGDATFGLSFRYVIPDQGPFDVRLNAPAGLMATVEPPSPARVELTSGSTATVEWTLKTVAAEDDAG